MKTESSGHILQLFLSLKIILSYFKCLYVYINLKIYLKIALRAILNDYIFYKFRMIIYYANSTQVKE